MDAIILLTNPWVALGGVAAVTLAAMGIALARLLAAGNDDGPDDGDGEAMPAAEGVEAVDAVLTDLAEIAKSVHVVVEVDGSVTVQDIPAAVPADLREVVARIAADAAVTHMQRTLRVRPTPSRDDRRLLTKAAREALIAEAKRRQHRPEAAAA
jgi:hypothetical protein